MRILRREVFGGREKIEEAFPPRREPPDETHHRRIRRDAQLGAAARRVLRGNCIRVEFGKVDPVAEQLDFFPAANALAHGRLQVLGVLRKDEVRAQRRDFLHEDVEPPRARAHVLVKVEAVNRVHDDGDAGEPGRELAEEAGLRGVGVDDREPLAPHHAEQPPQRNEIGQRRQIAAHRHGQMAHAAGFDQRHAFSRSRDAGDLVARRLQALHLIQQQRVQRNIDGRDMGDFYRVHCASLSMHVRCHSSKFSSSQRCASQTWRPS